MRYVLDTNIVLAFLRKHPVWSSVELKLKIYEPGFLIFIPPMVIGELYSIALQNNWGTRKKEELIEFMNEFSKADIISDEIVALYAEIDAFSQGRLEDKPLKASARNMGKNDLWIAAFASALNATLVTTDKDFQHLDNQYLKVVCFEI